MSEAETAWSRLASRVVRVALARKDIGYAQLAAALAADGVMESERALISRISRGTVKLSFFLQVLDLSGASPPPVWYEALAEGIGAEQRAQAVTRAELDRQPWVTIEELARRLSQFGTNVSVRTLASHIEAGTLSLSMFMQCITALGSTSLERYVDLEDLLSAAVTGRPGAPAS
ncbi:DUF6471 domain-containing protein [Paraburkholderia graminis]|uniref:DUF6471 domain-containing protein n=1 Tax=Paraburkholderia graminis TaxID=60548 RepID=UPI00278DA069|nr:DUF6471 domain-containing protein [Paraburkholderia graminis]MDQ0621004.1 hypothetical protein [Paraburkholderia graminis]MDR6478727.1 hypothetical protein [Paraburkholderia graminis]